MIDNCICSFLTADSPSIVVLTLLCEISFSKLRTHARNSSSTDFSFCSFSYLYPFLICHIDEKNKPMIPKIPRYEPQTQLPSPKERFSILVSKALITMMLNNAEINTPSPENIFLFVI